MLFWVKLTGAFDPELRLLELATDSELYELENMLFGPRYIYLFSQAWLRYTEVKNFQSI